MESKYLLLVVMAILLLTPVIQGGRLRRGRRLRLRRNNIQDSDCDSRDTVKVYLTVNSLIENSWSGSNSGSRRRLELNWIAPTDFIRDENDWVALFRGKPIRPSSRILLRVNASQPSGYFLTDQEVPSHPLSGRKSARASCIYGFWIAYIRNRRILKQNCLKIRPTWMQDERDRIGDVPLYKLMLPGTHNSGAYEFDTQTDFNIVDRFTVAQSEDVWNQLIYGIRYLDIRAGYKSNSPEKFWTMHDFVAMNPLYKVIQDIRKFLEATNEIVIMDFHRFPRGFQNHSMHEELVNYLIEELGEFMAPDHLGWRATPNELWRRNRTLIVSYAHDVTSALQGSIWPEVKHVWANTASEEQLKNHLQDAMNIYRYSRYPWAAMTHLTPSEFDVILNPTQGIRYWSNLISRQINLWYSDLWWDSANIVATDFFLGNNIIEESIIANRKRNTCQTRRRRSFY